MKKFFKEMFASIPTNNAEITRSDVWSTTEYDFGDGETVKVNKFGFDPNDVKRYLFDEYWMMSDDLRVWDKAQGAMKRYEELIKLFPRDAKNEYARKRYLILENAGKRLMRKADRSTRKIEVQINRWSDQYVAQYEAESKDGKKFFLHVLGRVDKWRPGVEIHEIEQFTLVEQNIYEINGEKVVEVVCYE